MHFNQKVSRAHLNEGCETSGQVIDRTSAVQAVVRDGGMRARRNGLLWDNGGQPDEIVLVAIEVATSHLGGDGAIASRREDDAIEQGLDTEARVVRKLSDSI